MPDLIYGSYNDHYHQWVISVLLALLAFHFWEKGHRFWIIPLAFPLYVALPVHNGFAFDWQGSVISSLILAAYIPGINRFLRQALRGE